MLSSLLMLPLTLVRWTIRLGKRDNGAFVGSWINTPNNPATVRRLELYAPLPPPPLSSPGSHSPPTSVPSIHPSIHPGIGVPATGQLLSDTTRVPPQKPVSTMISRGPALPPASDLEFGFGACLERLSSFVLNQFNRKQGCYLC